MDVITTIARLAGQAGLSRQEIQTLQWQNIDFEANRLRLLTRTIDLHPELVDYLQQCYQGRIGHSTYVIKGRGQAPMSVGSISRLSAQGAFSLTALRHGYIQEQLQKRPWQDVSRETGLAKETLIREFDTNLQEVDQLPSLTTVEQTLSHLEHTLGNLAVCLAYDCGYSVGELCQLRWTDVTQSTLSTGAAQMVTSLQGQGYVFPNKKGTAPLDAPRLSRLGRDALVNCGLYGLTLQTLVQRYKISSHHHHMVEALLKNKPYFTARMAQEHFGDNKSATYRQLQALVNAGVLVQVGGQYYDAKVVPALERHEELVLALAAENGLVYRGDVEACLGISARQCHKLLKTMVLLGKISQNGQKYLINDIFTVQQSEPDGT